MSHHEGVKHIANGLAVEDFIPCVLHMEMRVNEKLFRCLLAMALDRCLDGDSATRTLFIALVNDIMNTETFGDPAREEEASGKYH